MLQGHHDNDKLIDHTGPDSPGSEPPISVDTSENFEHLQQNTEKLEANFENFCVETLEIMLSFHQQLSSSNKSHKYFPKTIAKGDLQSYETECGLNELNSSKRRRRWTCRCVTIVILSWGTFFAGCLIIYINANKPQ